MNKTGKAVGIVIWLALLFWGLTGLYGRLVHGHADTNYGSYVPWGLWVAAYIYFIGLSAGAFLLSSLIYVFGFEQLRHIGRLALFTALATLFMSLLSIWFDLGHMERFYKVFTRPRFSSMMAWMVWLYTAYFVLVIAELWFELRCDLAARAEEGGALAPLYRVLTLGWRCPTDAEEFASCQSQNDKVMRVLGAVGVPLAIAFHGGVGALFATLSARPYWHTPLVPILFLTGALVSGGSLMLAIVVLFYDGEKEDVRNTAYFLSRIVLSLLLFDVMLEWAEFSIPLWYGVGREVELLKIVLFGPYWYVFWVVHLLLGTVIPVVLFLTRPRSLTATVVGGLLIATTFMAVRLNIVIPGFITPALRGLQRAYVDHRLQFTYVPSGFEWSVVAFVVAVGVAIFIVGHRVLPLQLAKTEVSR